MSQFGSSILFCAWLCLFCQAGLSLIYQEPVLEEGLPYVMNCSTNGSLDRWFIQWMFGDGKTATGCFKAGDCLNTFYPRYRFTAIENNNRIISLLTISNVTWEDRGTVFICKIYEKNGSMSDVLTAWKLSRTYSLPTSSPECVASLKDRTVHFNCTALNVYPGITCQPLKIVNEDKIKLDAVMKYEKKNSGFPEYYIDTCSASFPVCEGVHTYCMNITIGNRPQHSNKLFCSQKVIVNTGTTLSIIHTSSDIALCPGKEELVNVKCELWCWSSPSTPYLFWYLDDKLINNGNISAYTKIIDSQNLNWISILNISSSFIKDDKKSLKCVVDGKDTVNKTANYTAKLSFIWPVHNPPEFVYNKYKRTNNTAISIAKGENISFECVLNNVHQPEANLNIVCRDSYHHFVSNSVRRNRVNISFLFHNNTVCSCVAELTSGCNLTSSDITFVEIQPRTRKIWEPVDIEYIISYISAAILGLVALSVLFAMLLFFRAQSCHYVGSNFLRKSGSRKTDTCDNCVKSKISRRNMKHSSKTTKPVEMVTAYSIVDIVDQEDVNIDNDDSFYSSYAMSSKNEDEDISLRRDLQRFRQPQRQQQTNSSHYDSINEITTNLETANTGYNNIWFMNNIRSKQNENEQYFLHEKPPPLPPKSMWNTTTKLIPDVPVYARDELIYVTSQSHNLKPSTSNTSLDNKHTDKSILSLSKRFPPPKPCKFQSTSTEIIDNTSTIKQQFMINNSELDNDRRCEEERILINNKDIKYSNPQHELVSQKCPASPFRTRKKKSDIEKTLKVSETSRHVDNEPLRAEEKSEYELDTQNGTIQ